MGRRLTCSPHEDRFVELYVAGPDGLRGNGTRAYLEAYPSCHSEQAAAVGACRLLKRANVRTRMNELREQASADARARLRDWWELAPAAQETIRLTAAGLFDPMPDAPHGVRAEAIRSGVRSAQEVLNRAEGTPQQLHELRIEAGITVAIAGPGDAGQAGRLIELQDVGLEDSVPDTIRDGGAGPRQLTPGQLGPNGAGRTDDPTG